MSLIVSIKAERLETAKLKSRANFTIIDGEGNGFWLITQAEVISRCFTGFLLDRKPVFFSHTVLE